MTADAAYGVACAWAPRSAGRTGMSTTSADYIRGGRQLHQPTTFEEAAALPGRGGNYVWIELEEPGEALMEEAAKHFNLHELAVQDATCAHQPPKVEGYDAW